MNSQARPYYWKIPSEQKRDHISENYKRIKDIAADSQRKRAPLKAKFVPGVTRNSRYDHVPSKIGPFLRGEQPLPHRSTSEDLAFQQKKSSQNHGAERSSFHHRSAPPRNISQQQGLRMSRSVSDVRSQSNLSRSHSHYGNGNSQETQSFRPIRMRSNSNSNFSATPGMQGNSANGPSLKILNAEPPEESIYNWKLNDYEPIKTTTYSNRVQKPSFSNDSEYQQHPHPHPHCHRVEYVPCDGICAEETMEVRAEGDSARSSSSRTSRGCNTEETRIIPDSKSFRTNMTQRNFCSGDAGQFVESELDSITSKDNSTTALNGNTISGGGTISNNVPNGMERFQSDNPNTFYSSFTTPSNSSINQKNEVRYTGGLEESMKSLNMDGHSENLRSYRDGVGNNGRRMNAPHSLGTVPRYLKQRQNEWKEQQKAKVEAESRAHVPPGYILLNEDERRQHLSGLQKNYDMLIAELNRVPIRIDTIRVRNHKIDLEKKLSKLEETMKTFSRPTVWVKVDD